MNYDFCGYATKNDLKCSDGRVIRKNAFKVNDGKKVPLVWNHQHNDVDKILGHAVLENRDDGVYAYCKLNNSRAGQSAKEALKNGDISSLSIWANNLQQMGHDVIHGVIREVSLVLAGANPGAFIESVLVHSEPIDEDDDEGIFYTGEEIIIHADEPEKKKEEENMAEEKKEEKTNGEKTVEEVFNTLTDEQKTAVAIIVGQIIKDSKNENEEDEEEEEMKHNVFEDSGELNTGQFLSHSDFQKLMKDAKRLGSFRSAVDENMQEDGILAHAIDSTGLTGPSPTTALQDYGVRDFDMLLPDYQSLNTPPEFISRDMGWVAKVMNGVHKTPFSRIKSVFADITEDEARAKGYIKGKQKKDEVFTLLKRTTDPQTIYKRQKIDRDDLLDITDFDVLVWLKREMDMMWDEEVARAILIGDGRDGSSDDKISEDHIRSVVNDVALFNIKVVVEVASDADEATIAKETIKAVLRARKDFKGTGVPTFWTTSDTITEMLLLEDAIDHRLYKTEAELATALRVREVVEVEPMAGVQVQHNSEKLDLIGIVWNPIDYNVGHDRKGEKTWFDQFDIDYNQQKFLVEARASGALIRPFSAITVLLKKVGG